MNTAKPEPLKPEELERLYVKFQRNVCPHMIDDLAKELGAKSDSVTRLGVGYDFIENSWIFAERDERGHIIGLSTRYHDRSKRMVPGSKRGLIYECIGTIEKSGRTFHNSGFTPARHAGVDCPKCGERNWCMVSSDNPNNPSAVICGRVKEGSVKHIKDSGYLHRLYSTSQNDSVLSVIRRSDKPYIVVEGASDVLAAMDLGYIGVGKPSAESGSGLVAALLKDKSAVIFGENDAGVGLRGMDRTFTQCKPRCKELAKCLPPVAHKDLRHWLASGLTTEEFAAWIVKESDKCDKTKLIYGQIDLVDFAERFIEVNEYQAGGKKRLLRHHDGWWVYKAGKYAAVEPENLKSQVSETFHGFEFFDDVTEKTKPVNINDYFKREVLSAVCDKTVSSVPKEVMEPCWVKSGKPFANAYAIMFKNGVFDVANNKLMAHSNDLFTTATLSYDYNSHAECKRWTTVVNEWFEEDEERIALLQEWFGYNMIMSNHLEQLMFIYGRPGSGKSTAVNVLQHLLDGNYIPATLQSLTGDNFGMAPLVGKYACLISEEDTVSHMQARKLLTIMKRITGNDAVSIRRMRSEAVLGHLFCKITYFSNSLPIFYDETQSLFRRYNLLQFRKNFASTIDTNLFQKLQGERQGVAVWAVEGLRRLIRNNGKFTLPALSAAEIKDIKEELQMSVDELYALYLGVCEEDRVQHPIGRRRIRRICREASPKFDRLKETRIGSGRGWVNVGVSKSAHEKYLEK
jgi:P4 family phage/plasmid primase-like protien